MPEHAVSCAKMAEPIKMPFGLWTQVGQGKHVLHGRHLANTNEPSMFGDDAAWYVILLWPLVPFQSAFVDVVFNSLIALLHLLSIILFFLLPWKMQMLFFFGTVHSYMMWLQYFDLFLCSKTTSLICPRTNEAQISQRDCTTHCVTWNLVNCCITVWKVPFEKVCNRWMTLKVTQGHWNYCCLICLISILIPFPFWVAAEQKGSQGWG